MTKIPAPMTAPTPRAVNWKTPSVRFRLCEPVSWASSKRSFSGFRASKFGMCLWVLSLLQLVGKNGIPHRRRINCREQFQALAQVAAGHLARARLHVDIAAGAMQVKRQCVFEGLPCVVPKQL